MVEMARVESAILALGLSRSNRGRQVSGFGASLLMRIHGTAGPRMALPVSQSRRLTMKIVTALGMASAVAMMAAAAPADARQGCGAGFHRAPNGVCRPNRGNRVVFVEGRYYPGRGYWWHNRWYHQRHRRHGVWVYL
jgi:hypothetical protein